MEPPFLYSAEQISGHRLRDILFSQLLSLNDRRFRRSYDAHEYSLGFPSMNPHHLSEDNGKRCLLGCGEFMFHSVSYG